MKLSVLVDKLNPQCKSALEGSATLCMTKTNYSVEIEHWLATALEQDDNDIHRLLRQFDLNAGQVLNQVQKTMEKLKTGNGRTPTISEQLIDLMREAWNIGSLEFGAGELRTGYLFAALVTEPKMRQMATAMVPAFSEIDAQQLQQHLGPILQLSPEHRGSGAATAAGPEGAEASSGEGAPASAPSANGALAKYTENLTQQARDGKIDSIVGRDSEIRQILDILSRRRQNNPILTGEAGVGKTAVVEGLALAIAGGHVPSSLKEVELHTLDLGLLQAGAGVKGEFENRLKNVINEVKASEKPIILFIDEAHTLIGAGGSAGQGDAANLLKPALARGELRTIAATTWAEYKKYFEKDPALTRRFQVIKVEEPSVESAILMMRKLCETLQKHHEVRIMDNGIEAAVRLSHRYLPARQLPDKSVSVLDTACARVRLSQSAFPASLEDAQQRVEGLQTEKRWLSKEQAAGQNHDERLQEINSEIKSCEKLTEELSARFEEELAMVTEINSLQKDLWQAIEENKDSTEFSTKLREAENKLEEIQGEQPLVQACVNEQSIGEVISAWTGIPLGKMIKDELQTVLDLESILQERVIGQDHGLKAIAQRIQTSRAGLDDPQRPVGVFMLVGPSGVGKTETALALSESLYGGERNLITINMSEYQEAHTVSSLKGSPPGYVGYGEGGVLTEAVRRRPYSVVLLDEVEKAHPDVMELFFQVFDKGTLEDGEGRVIDFKNCVILLTSNVGTDEIMDLCQDPELKPNPEGLVEGIRPQLLNAFPAALLGRMVVVPYYPIEDSVLEIITKLKLNKIVKRVKQQYGVDFKYSEEVVKAVRERCHEVDSGARNVDHILTRTVLPQISEKVLLCLSDGVDISHMEIGLEDGQFVYEVR